MANYQDFILPFEVNGTAVRGRIVKLNDAWQQIKARHQYPSSVNMLLSETMILAILFSSQFKFDGIFTLQILSESGVVGTLVADITSQGHVRAVARYDSEHTPQEVDQDQLISQLMPEGQMIFTIDQGQNTERYQTITALGNGNLEEAGLSYLKQADQIDTHIKLFANGDNLGGILLQRMPDPWRDNMSEEEASEKYTTLKTLVNTLTADEILSPSMSGETILYRLFNEFSVNVFDVHPLRDQCRCSEKKVTDSLKGFPQDELLSMMDEGSDVVDIKCEFCSREYKIPISSIIPPAQPSDKYN